MMDIFKNDTISNKLIELRLQIEELKEKRDRLESQIQIAQNSSDKIDAFVKEFGLNQEVVKAEARYSNINDRIIRNKLINERKLKIVAGAIAKKQFLKISDIKCRTLIRRRMLWKNFRNSMRQILSKAHEARYTDDHISEAEWHIYSTVEDYYPDIVKGFGRKGEEDKRLACYVRSIEDISLRLVIIGLWFVDENIRHLYESPRLIEGFKKRCNEFGIGMFLGDGCYGDGDIYLGFKDGVFEVARKDVISRYGGIDLIIDEVRISKLEKEKDSLDEKISSLEDEFSRMDIFETGQSLLSEKQQLEEVQDEGIIFLGQKAKSATWGLRSFEAKQGVVATLHEVHFTKNGPGVECGVILNVWKYGQVSSRYFQYRHPESERLDNYRNDYESLSIVDVSNERVVVALDNWKKVFICF